MTRAFSKVTLYPAYKLRILATNHLLNLYPKCDVYCHQVEHIFLTKQLLIKEMWNVKRARYTRVSGLSVNRGIQSATTWISLRKTILFYRLKFFFGCP